MTEVYRIAIVDDEVEVREGLRYLVDLRENFTVVEVFADAESFLKRLPFLSRLDLVLMDIGLPGMDGIEALRQVKKQSATTRVLILTVFEDEARILTAIRNGADGYLLKTTKPESLVEQIHEVINGLSPLSPAVASRLIEQVRKTSDPTSPTDYGLTPREREIIGDVASGMTYREIAGARGIAASTAKKHILHIYQKLDVSTRAEFVRKVIDEDLI